jgi:endonuclease/exonuclease/phosphatase family metal-dependent hydrolase
MATLAELAADPRTHGLLGPVSAGGLPAPVMARTDDAGVRLASINIHMATPAFDGLFPQTNERLEALRDVARWVKAVDPDVLFVQELRNRPVAAAIERGGIGDAASTLGRLIDADDLAFTPAIAQDPFTTPHAHYGTGIYVRNGFAIDQAINARLPTSTPDVELRSVGVAGIRAPDGREPLTVMGTHLANRVVEDQPLRDAQLAAIMDLADQVSSGGRVAYVDALGGHAQLSSGSFPTRRLALVGDFNQEQAPTDLLLNPRGFVHANDLLASRGDARSIARAGAANVDTSIIGQHRIDHPYLRGTIPTDSAVGEVHPHAFPGVATDHLGLVVDLP